MKRLSSHSAIAAAWLATAPAFAAPEEIQVYMDELTKPGHVGIDLHNNYAISGMRDADSPGMTPSHHQYRFTPELYLGLTPTLELGVYLLTTSSPDVGRHYEGEKLRLKYIAPHDETAGSFWGVNAEVGRTSSRVSEVPWNAQLKGIYGFRTGKWTVAFNGNLDWSLHGAPNTPVMMEVDTKVAYQMPGGYQLGFESYNGLGPASSPGRLKEQSHMFYAVIDAEIGKLDLNAGIGRGLTPTSDRWIAKVILGLQY
jgi:hypothetical protein